MQLSYFRYKDYYTVVKQPISLAEIEAKVYGAAYDTVDDMEVRFLVRHGVKKK